MPRQPLTPAKPAPVLNVAIVNDSRSAAEVLRRILATLPGFTLLWTAGSGEEALRLAQAHPPDIVLMDLIMPGMDGAETTQHLMRVAPCVVLVVTATTAGNRGLVFEAMGHGALDAVNTPTLGLDGSMDGAEPLLQKLRTVARLVERPPAAPVRSPSTLSLSKQSTAEPQLPIVALGASTGGPQALAQVLSHLPANFPAAVLIAQHVDDQFSAALADWLQHHTPLPVRVARDRDVVTPGSIWLAGTADHLILTPGGILRYTAHPRSSAYRPSADVLFHSLAESTAPIRIGTLLTGMGRDGAQGLLALRNSGALTLTQDAASCIVYGMPKAAAELHAATEILPLTAIGPRILKAIPSTTLTANH